MWSTDQKGRCIFPTIRTLITQSVDHLPTISQTRIDVYDLPHVSSHNLSQIWSYLASIMHFISHEACSTYSVHGTSFRMPPPFCCIILTSTKLCMTERISKLDQIWEPPWLHVLRVRIDSSKYKGLGGALVDFWSMSWIWFRALAGKTGQIYQIQATQDIDSSKSYGILIRNTRFVDCGTRKRNRKGQPSITSSKIALLRDLRKSHMRGSSFLSLPQHGGESRQVYRESVISSFSREGVVDLEYALKRVTSSDFQASTRRQQSSSHYRQLLVHPKTNWSSVEPPTSCR